MTRFSCEIQLWQLPGDPGNFKFWNQPSLLTRMRVLDDGFVMFSVNGISRETSGISSFIKHLVSTYYVANRWSARNREMKSSVFPKELLVWGQRQILKQKIIKWGENTARKICTGHHGRHDGYLVPSGSARARVCPRGTLGQVSWNRWRLQKTKSIWLYC